MAVQIQRSSTIQSLDNMCELNQLLRLANQDAILCFMSEKSDTCKRLEPVMQQLAGRYNGTVFAELDIARFSDAAQQYRVTKTPTFIAFRGDKEVDRLEDGDEQRLTEFVNRRGQMREMRGAIRPMWKSSSMAARPKKPMMDMNAFNEQRMMKQQDSVLMGGQKQSGAAMPRACARMSELPLMRQCEPEAAAHMAKRRGVAAQLRRLGSKVMHAGQKMMRRMKGDAALKGQRSEGHVWNATMMRARNEQEFNRLMEQVPDAIVYFVDGEWDAMAMSRNVDALGLRYPSATFIIADFKRMAGLAQRYNVTKAPAIVSVRFGEVGEQLEFVGGSTMNTDESCNARNLGQYFPRSKRFAEGVRRKRQCRNMEKPMRWRRCNFQYGSASPAWRQQQMQMQQQQKL